MKRAAPHMSTSSDDDSDRDVAGPSRNFTRRGRLTGGPNHQRLGNVIATQRHREIPLRAHELTQTSTNHRLINRPSVTKKPRRSDISSDLRNVHVHERDEVFIEPDRRVTRGNIIDDIEGVDDDIDLTNGFERDPRDVQHDLKQPIYSQIVRHVSFSMYIVHNKMCTYSAAN
jgi:hypothetical protein